MGVDLACNFNDLARRLLAEPRALLDIAAPIAAARARLLLGEVGHSALALFRSSAGAGRRTMGDGRWEEGEETDEVGPFDLAREGATSRSWSS